MSAVVVGSILAPLALFAALAVRASSVESTGSEEGFVEWMYGRTRPAHDAIDLFLAFGRLGGLLLFGLLAIGLIARGRVLESAFLVVALAGAAALAVAAQAVVNGLSTVEDGTTLDFPSGHAAASLSAVGAALLVLRRRAGLSRRAGLGITTVALTLVVAYGAAMVARNWHRPSEVLAGWCIGLAWLSFVWIGAALLESSDVRSAPAAPKGT